MPLAVTKKLALKMLLLIAAFNLLAFTVSAQVKAPTPRPKEVLKDPDGNAIPNNEWRDYSLSDPRRRDPFTRTVLADGSVELKLNRNPFEGRTAPKFTAQSIDGKVIAPADISGKVVVLNFWYIGCPVCRSEKPKLNDLEAKFKNDGVIFISFALDNARDLFEYTKTAPVNYHLVANGQPVMDLFKVDSFPKNIVIGGDGKIVYWRSNVTAWDQFTRVINTELEKTRK